MKKHAVADYAEARAGSRGRWWLTLPVLCIPVLVVQIDTSIVNLGVQPMRDYFDASTAAMQWVVDSYNLLYAVLLLTGGQLADLYGRRRLLMYGVAIFTAASLLCAIAPNITVLIAGRALAGGGAALLLPATLAVIRAVWPDPAERGTALGIWAACNGLALAVGPPLGGGLVNLFGWRSLFLAITPLALLTLLATPCVVPESTEPDGRHFDLGGQLLGTLVLGGLASAAMEVLRLPLVAFVAMAIVLLALLSFVRAESSRGAAALVPLDIFRIPRFWRAMLATAGMTFGMYGLLFVLPLAWMAMGRLGPVGAGAALLPMALLFVVTSPFSGRLNDALGVRVVTGGGVAVIASGLLLVAASVYAGSMIPAEIGCALTGVGMGLATGPLVGVAVGAVPVARSGTASALINVARMVGATMGVALLGGAFALPGNPASGLWLAMASGSAVQFAAATVAFTIPKQTGAAVLAARASGGLRRQ